METIEFFFGDDNFSQRIRITTQDLQVFSRAYQWCSFGYRVPGGSSYWVEATLFCDKVVSK